MGTPQQRGRRNLARLCARGTRSALPLHRPLTRVQALLDAAKSIQARSGQLFLHPRGSLFGRRRCRFTATYDGNAPTKRKMIDEDDDEDEAVTPGCHRHRPHPWVTNSS